jgi:hypothetical protein
MFKTKTTKTMIYQVNLASTQQKLLEVNKNKTELINIMNDYLTKEATRTATTDRLDTLRAKFA